MRLLLTGGGTAGHVYPVLSVVEVLRAQQPADLSLVWVGSHTGIEGDIIRRSQVAFRGIGLRGGVRGVGPLAAIRGGAGVVAGTLQAMRIIRAERPQVIMATGGYVSVPAVLAGWLLRVPSLIYLPDVEPGWAVKFLAPLARRIAVTTDDSRPFFPAKKVFVSGYPVRSAFFNQDQKAAREAFGLDPDLRTIVVMGGSRGSHSINVALSGTLMHLLLGYQIIHVTGQAEASAMRALRDDLPKELKRRYRPYGFLNEDMAKAYAAADIVVSRSGASVLGEIPAAGVAAILVPYAGGHHDQAQNAAFLAARGAAIVIEDASLSPTLLEEKINEVAEPARLATMRQAAAALARPDAAEVIASELQALARR